MAAKRSPIIAHHLIWTLYGHWLANDLRGSGSQALREGKFAPLGDFHFGRKPADQQPSRQELRKFQQQAEPLLEHKKFWLDAAKRQALGNSFASVIQDANYTVYACAMLSNHIHLVVRRHRDDALTMWHRFAKATSLRLRDFPDIDEKHPVWSSRPYKVFLKSPHAVRSCIVYVEQNPLKEGLARQDFEFVQTYNNWPFHKH